MPDDNLKAWQDAFYRMHDWLEEDRDRRSVVIAADNYELWWVGVRIDHRTVSAERGYELPDVVAGAMAGMIIEERGGTPVPDEEFLCP